MFTIYQLIAFGVMFIGGAAGGAFAGSYTKTDLPRTPEEDVGIQKWVRRNPVLTLILFGAIGGLLVPFVVTALSGVFGDNTVLQRVLSPDVCGERHDILAKYQQNIVDGKLNKDAFVAAIQGMDFSKGPGNGACGDWVKDVAILFGLAVIVGYSIRALIPSLSATVLQKLSEVDAKAAAAAEAAANAHDASTDAAIKSENARVAAEAAANASESANETATKIEQRTQSPQIAFEMAPQHEKDAFHQQLQSIVQEAVKNASKEQGK